MSSSICFSCAAIIFGPALLYAVLNLFVRRWRVRTPEEIRKQRLREGRCVACGYDLRASPQRCPECGAERLRH